MLPPPRVSCAPLRVPFRSLICGFAIALAAATTAQAQDDESTDERASVREGVSRSTALPPAPQDFGVRDEDFVPITPLPLLRPGLSAQPVAISPAIRQIGIRFGAFTLVPAVTAGVVIDDNVYAQPVARFSDQIAILRPELIIRHASANHVVQLHGLIEQKSYQRFDQESQVNGGTALDAQFRTGPNTLVQTRLRYNRGHEARGNPEDLVFQYDQPVGYNQYEAAGVIKHRFGRFWGQLGAANQWITYDAATINGFAIDQSYRSGDVANGAGRLGAALAPATSVFVEAAPNRRRFGNAAFNSAGYHVVGGVLLEPGQQRRLHGEIYAGYLNQDYVGATFDTISTWTAGGKLVWAISSNFAMSLEGKRLAKETALLFGGISVLESTLGGKIEARLTPHLTATGGASVVWNELNGLDRTDRLVSPMASIRYSPNPHIALALEYQYLRYMPDAAGAAGYMKNLFLFKASTQL